jgi:hypothetical protein
MENKYFTPDIEDIHIGYECEILYPHNMIKYNEKLNENLWEKHKFELQESLSEGDSMSFDYIYRTLYLTKEQIEAEGWETTDEGVDSRGEKILYKNCKKDLNIFNLKYYLIFNEIEKSLNIYMRKSLFDDSITSNLYNGECKDINTFRKIIKLLGI